MFCCSSRKPCLTDIASSPVDLVELTMGLNWFLSTHTIFILTRRPVQTHTHADTTTCMAHKTPCNVNYRGMYSIWTCAACAALYFESWVVRQAVVFGWRVNITAGYSYITRHRMHLDLQRWWSAPSVWPVSPGIIGTRWFDFPPSLSRSLLAARLRAAGADSRGCQD